MIASEPAGAWRSLGARLLWEQKVRGSSPRAPTISPAVPFPGSETATAVACAVGRGERPWRGPRKASPRCGRGASTGRTRRMRRTFTGPSPRWSGIPSGRARSGRSRRWRTSTPPGGRSSSGRRGWTSPPTGLARALARESAEHAGRLGELLGTDGEPWHRIASGGFLRNAVYGFNDGLTANFGLVMGVLGASVPPRVVLLSGIAGLIADALSMGSSGFLAAKSEQEVYAHEIAVEREEIRLMPDLEEEELALLYQSRGIGPEVARQLARDIMSRPDQALREKTHMELGIGELEISPLREGWITGLSTAVGAFIPVLPFLVLPGPVAAWTSFAISMLSHFAVGAARSVFTGRGPIRSGIDMFLVGLGVAVVGYMVGDRIAHVLAVGRAP